MITTDQRVERRYRHDERGVWHRVASASCDDCGCRYEYALDRPGVIWDPGLAVEVTCRDRLCDCHVDPLNGEVVEGQFLAAEHSLAS
jgi:hypothetical protein